MIRSCFKRTTVERRRAEPLGRPVKGAGTGIQGEDGDVDL